MNRSVDARGIEFPRAVRQDDETLKRRVLELEAQVAELGRFERMLDAAPVNLMYCDTDLKIQFMNATSRATLSTIEQYLPVKAAEMVGVSLDVFPKDPSLTREVLLDPTRLPHRAQIALGPEHLSLLVTARYDDNGAYLGPAVVWELVTDKVRLRMKEMIESAPLNVMFCDAALTIRYANTSALATLKRLERHHPLPTTGIVGAPIGAFHESLSQQARILREPKNLPHRTTFEFGPETVALLATAIADGSGAYVGPMLTWEVITEQLAAEERQNIVLERERKAAEEVSTKVATLLTLVDRAAKGDLTASVTVDRKSVG